MCLCSIDILHLLIPYSHCLKATLIIHMLLLKAKVTYISLWFSTTKIYLNHTKLLWFYIWILSQLSISRFNSSMRHFYYHYFILQEYTTFPVCLGDGLKADHPRSVTETLLYGILQMMYWLLFKVSLKPLNQTTSVVFLKYISKYAHLSPHKEDFFFFFLILWRQSEYSQGWFLTILDVAFECPAPKVGHLKSP